MRAQWVYQTLERDAGFWEGMREIWVCWTPEEDVGYWEYMREIWVYWILEGGADIDPAASCKKVCGHFLWLI